MIERTMTYPMPGQAAINALKYLRTSRRQRLQEFAASTLKHVYRRLMPDDAAIAAKAARWTGWY